jgi:hypothetical protein
MLRDFGISEGKSLEIAFSSGWNNKCDPPWSADELESLISHVARYTQNRPGSKPDLMAMHYEQLNDDVKMAESIEAGIIEEPIEDDWDAKWMDSNVFNARGKRRQYIIPGWLPATGLTAVNAKRGTGKSTILLDLAYRIATDGDWHGLPLKTGYNVIYFVGEDDEGMELSSVCWTYKHEKTAAPGRLVFVDGIPDLKSVKDVTRFATKAKDLMGDTPTVLIFDTWQRATSHAAQNSDEDMQACVAHAEAMAEVVGAPCIAAFHPPKHDRSTILGSSITENSTSAIWQIEEVAEGVCMKVERIKGRGHGNDRTYRFDTVELPEADPDCFGDNYVGIVPRKIAGTESKNETDMILNEEGNRRAWAWFVRGAHDGPYMFDEKPFPLSKNSVQEYMLEKYKTYNITSNPDLKAKMEPFISKYIRPLLDRHIVNLNKSSCETKLSEYFTSDNRTDVIFHGEGLRLTVGLDTKAKIESDRNLRFYMKEYKEPEAKSSICNSLRNNLS